MARDFTKRKPVAQPQYAGAIDWSNPIARGLVFFYVGSSKTEIVSDDPPIGATTASGIRRITGPLRSALARSMVSPNFFNFQDRIEHNTLGDVSAVWAGAIDTTATNDTFIVKGQGFSANSPLLFYANAWNPRLIRANAVGRGLHTATGITLAAGVHKTVGVTSGSLIEVAPVFYDNGRRYAGSISSSNTSTGAPTATTNPIALSAALGGSTLLTGRVEFAAVWGRKLTDAEHWLMYSRPYDLLIARPLYYPVPAAAGGFQAAWAANSNTYLGGGLYA